MSKITKKKIPVKTSKAIEKLAQITRELYQGNDYNITRLTTLKSLCQEPDRANHFVLYLAQRTQERMEEREPEYISPEKWRQHKTLVREAIEHITRYLNHKTGEGEKTLQDLLYKIKQLQNTYENQRWGQVRVIESSETLVVEKAIECILSPENSAFWGYHVGREYAERYNPHYGTGLIPESAPLMEDIVNFWYHYYDMR